jgi:putative serine protease PepD
VTDPSVPEQPPPPPGRHEPADGAGDGWSDAAADTSDLPGIGVPAPRQETAPGESAGRVGEALPTEDPQPEAGRPEPGGAEAPPAEAESVEAAPTEVLDSGELAAPPWWMSRAKVVACVAAIALCASALGGVVGGILGANSAAPNPMVSAGGRSSDQDPSGSLVPGVAAAASRSVAEIVVTTGIGKETGSGIVLSSDGRILTNYHVVATAYGGDITVRLAGAGGAETTSARVLGTEPAKDLAVIQADRVSGLVPAELGDSSQVPVGSPVVAIGSPQGLRGTVTSGIVSAVDRELRVDDRPGLGVGTKPVTYKAIQTDATLHPGNSGGPLVTMDGQVIGINSAIYAAAAEADGSGLGFAIPINQAKGIVNRYGATDGMN